MELSEASLSETATLSDPAAIPDSTPHDWYQGRCPTTGEWLRLPRTSLVEAIARHVASHLQHSPQVGMHQVGTQPARPTAADEGKMIGILLVEDAAGDRAILKAFSGLWHGRETIDGWVPPIPGRDRTAMEEARILALLDSIKHELLRLQTIPERQLLEQTSHQFATQIQALLAQHRQQKQQRQQQRQQILATHTGDDLTAALDALTRQSQQAGIAHRHLKRERDAVLHPLQAIVAAADARMLALKRRRRELSRHLQTQMHAHYHLTNFAGQSRTLEQLMQGGLPTGTGDCCAPKLLHYAATQGLTPLALAEIWWGAPSGDKQPGVFYTACAERCQPLMGFLLSGSQPASNFITFNEAEAERPLPILYQDDWLIAVDKPAGLLSVPGRTSDRHDSVLSRLRLQVSEGDRLIPVHRLDQDTSGVLLLARDAATHRHLSQQFQQRTVHKLYEAVVLGQVLVPALNEPQASAWTTLDLPLWGDPTQRPYQTVDWQRGKPSRTRVRVLSATETQTRLELQPVTGRTHQLRVHAAHPQGLGAPIVGDRLYGTSTPGLRLHLHSRELWVLHPDCKTRLQLQAPTPF
ncbi:MAG: RluA family pseudouridine synthase [Kaiparowitsia implicata GSE-PSE-MK54-09C]|nr:RluA family pseudouridine synthase [Kaiparowitsia implicata GSE-PSE-MK54-09C]